MDWKINLELIFCFFLFFGYILEPTSSARQNPLKDPKICGRPICDLETDKFHWHNKIRYKYNYNIHIRSEFYGSGENKSDLYLTSKVNLIFPTKCEGVLTLTNVELREQPPPSSSNSDDENSTNDDGIIYDYDIYGDNEDATKTTTSEPIEKKDETLHEKSLEIGKALERFDLRFSFHDGIISEVCQDSNEPIWVLNFKKGIISQLQNTMLRFDVDMNTTETDISGLCNVAYSFEGVDGTSVLIKKIKDIDSCRSRIKMQSVLQTTPYQFRDDKVIWPILNSKSYCNITVDHNIYKEISCLEYNQMIPFSNNLTGAVTESHSTLILDKEDSYTPPTKKPEDPSLLIEGRSTLLFDHTPSLKPIHDEIKTSRDLLKKMCSLGYPNIQREFIETFTKFLATAKQLSYKALHQLLVRSTGVCASGTAKDHIYESLPYIGSTASYQLMRDEIIGEKIPKEVAKSWMTSLSFLLRPDEETLETFFTLIEYGKKKIDPEYTLSATAVVHTFCRHISDCDKNPKVLKIVQKLEEEFLELLKSNINDRRVHERLSILLKGIGNIGVMTEKFERKLKNLIESEEKLPTEIRVDVVLAFRKYDCVKNKDFFLSIYRNVMINSEIRILSYLQMMRCPDYMSINEIKRVLENEQINQVGSFVWSHLKNIAKSASPIRVEAQGLLASDDLGNKFNMDIRKFSRNYEYSLFFDEYNVGAEAETNLIFGTDSYLPRILNLNFTADLFGESVNFFEVTARAQGFEQFVASIFGPKGPLNSDFVKKKFSFLNSYLGDGDSSETSNEDFIDLEKLRHKRSTIENEDEEHYNFEVDEEEPEKIKTHDRQIQKEVENLGYKLKYDHGKPRAVFGLRVFGNDLRYTSIDGMNEVMGAAYKMDPRHIIASILAGQEIKYSQSGILLDASYNVPLLTGLPLSIKAFGASSLDFRLAGSYNRFDNDGSWSFDIEGKFKPSISIDVLTSMETDFYYAMSGIRVKSNLYSSSHVETKVKVRGANLVSVSIGLPQDKNEIFSAKSDLIVFKGGEEIPQSGIEKRSSNTTCTWPVLDSALGVKVCSHYSLPDLSDSEDDTTYPGLILSGPTNIRIYLEKTDPSIKEFLFIYQWQQEDDKVESSLIFHTPYSVNKRLMTANLTRVPDAFNASVGFLLAQMSYSAVGQYQYDPNDTRFEFYVESNGKKNLALYANLNRTEIQNGYVYFPHFRLLVNNVIIAGLSGTMKIKAKSGIQQNEFDVMFETKKMGARLDGYVEKTEIKTTTRMKIGYRFEEGDTEKIEFNSELENQSKRLTSDYRGKVKLLTTAYPKLNFAGHLRWYSRLARAECNITYNNAPDLIDPNYSTHFNMTLRRTEADIYSDTPGKSTALAKFDISRARANIDYGFRVRLEEVEKNGTAYTILTGLKYATDKEIKGHFLIHLLRKYNFGFRTYAQLEVPDFDAAMFQLEIIELVRKMYKFDFDGTWFTNHSIHITGKYKDRGNKNHIIKSTNLVVRSPSFEEITADIDYRRSQNEAFTNVKGTIGKIPYELMLKYTQLSSGQKNTFIEFKKNDELYSLSAKLLKDVDKVLQVDIHWDKIRDISSTVRALSLPLRKELLFELKWDANRDPSQWLAFQASYNNPRNKKYDANIKFTYPEKTFSCGFDVYMGGPDYYGQTVVTWKPDQAVILKYDAGLFAQTDDFDYNTYINVDIITPFEGWKRNYGKCGIYLADNLIMANGSMLWAENQDIAIIYKSDYNAGDDEIRGEINFSINSSLPDVPTLSSHLRHKHSKEKIFTDADFRYKTMNQLEQQAFSIKSDWEIREPSKNWKEILGKVSTRTPFDGYKSGNLNLNIKRNIEEDGPKTIEAAGTLKFDDKSYKLNLDGYYKKINDNMLDLIITTPLPRYPKITGKLGYIEEDRHAVAMLTSTGGSLGAEILLAIEALTDFDIKFHLATPIETLERVLLVAKLKPDTMDYRGGLNNVTIGFTGIWRYLTSTDMEYSYRFFTPLKNFEENGLELKYLLQPDQFVINAYIKITTSKIGFLIKGDAIPVNIKSLPVMQDVQLTKEPGYQIPRPDYIDEEELDGNDLFGYDGIFEFDTMIYPTIKGQIDIQEKSDYWFINGNLDIQKGRIVFQDHFFFPDVLHIENVLKVTTPFDNFNEILSKFHHQLKLKELFVNSLKVSNKNITIGYFFNYTNLNETDIRTKEVAITVYTPFIHFEKVDAIGSLEIEEFTYRANITTKTLDTTLSLAGSLEYDDTNYIDVSLGLDLNSIEVPNYGCWFHIKKDLSGNEHSIEFDYKGRDNGVSKIFKFSTIWKPNGTHFVDGRCRIDTNLIPLKVADTSVFITQNPHPILNFDLKLIDNKGEKIEYFAKADRKRNIVNININTPIRNFENISMYGILSEDKRIGDYIFKGNLSRNSQISDIEGKVTFDVYKDEQNKLKSESGIPTKVYLNNRPKVGPPGLIEFELKKSDEKYGRTFSFNSIEDGKMCQISGGYLITSLLNWEVSVTVQSTQPEISRIVFATKIKPKSQNIFEGNFDLQTPWKHLGIENVNGKVKTILAPENGLVETEYGIENYRGKGNCQWTFIFMEDMQISLETEVDRIDKIHEEPKKMKAHLMYTNPNKNFKRFLTGGSLDVHSKWSLDVNGTMSVSNAREIKVGLHTKLPRIISEDIHHVEIKYRGNVHEEIAQNFKNPIDVLAQAKYESEINRTRYLIKGNFRNIADIQGMGHVEWGQIDNGLKVIDGDFQILSKDNKKREFYVKATTPYYEGEESFYLTGLYDYDNLHHVVKSTLKSPASRKLFETDMSAMSASNLHGFVNSTIPLFQMDWLNYVLGDVKKNLPFFKIDWLRADINFTTHGGSSYRYLKGTWPTNTAFIQTESEFSTNNLDRDLIGKIILDVPLATRHRADIDYKLEERKLIKTGYTNVIYNNKKVLQGQYKCNSEERSGFEKDVIDITLENEFKPLGIHYVHTKEYTDAEIPDYDYKHAELFELKKEKEFNLTGELHIKRDVSGGLEYKIVAIHPNRTVILNSEFNGEEGKNYLQKTKLQLSKTAWIGYNIKTENVTENGSQKFFAELSYPKRTISADGWYLNTEKEFDSNVIFKWTIDKKWGSKVTQVQKQMNTGFNWKNLPLHGIDKDHQIAVLRVGHPSLKKDATLQGTFYRSPIELVRFGIQLDYDNSTERLLNIEGVLRDDSPLASGNYNYSYSLIGNHKQSQFDLNVEGIATARPAFYYTRTDAYYKRNYYLPKKGLLLGKLDLVRREIEYERMSPDKAVRFWFIPNINYPIYGFNGTIMDTPETNSTGFFYVNLADKYTRMEVNMSEDASQNLQMIGRIPDARSAYFDVWRNYEEIRIVDVTSYIKMNHSRLFTGRFHWRPKIKDELKQKMKQFGDSFYDSFSDGIDFWIKTIYSESNEVIADIWDDAKGRTKEFMNDLREIKVLEDDIEDFRKFVNSSYDANDFYVKTLVNFTLTVLDELALRNHIESLPKIVSEAWQAMGESGKAFRKSVLWIFDTVKSSYHKALEIITKFLHGDLFEQISKIMESGIEKYDKFVKDLHISFVKYVQNMWNKGSAALTMYWRVMLKKMEPHVFRFIHYIESAVWSFSKELFDFIYNRTNEIAESPYYSQVSQIAGDIDHFYKDIQNNDALTNIRKYSTIAWKFIKEKYFKLVPFGKELDNVVNELMQELEKLKDLPHVQMILIKWDELMEKLEWISDEFELEKRLNQLLNLIIKKLRHLTMTALEADDMYREAKTLFVYDPEAGVIDLEQKLPMSWHAFNETPRFEEIPEYKMIGRVQDFFAGSNFSLIGEIYRIRSNLEPKTWLPPYTAHALLIGSRHYMTFDNTFVGLNLNYEMLRENDKNQDKCSYLLAHDFFQNNFTLLLEPSILTHNGKKVLTRKLTLLTDKHHIEIDVNADFVKIGNNLTPTLPVKLGDAVVYRESDVVTVHSDQEFTLNCNLQFDLCWMELGSWYFGQTAGLLGTMNNEPFDDLTKSNGRVTTNQNDFVKSWRLNDCKSNKNHPGDKKVKSKDPELLQLCNEFFKTESFSTCFEFINPEPFYEMCLDMSSNSISTVLKDNHPAKKGSCTAALGYIEACDAIKIPLRVPDKCVHCSMPNGSYVSEGTFIRLEENELPQSADIVFIIEAKTCNHNVTYTRNLMMVTNALEKELKEVNIVNNRYSVLAFGGRSPFDKPRNIVHNNKIFVSDINLLPKYFDHIQTNNGSNHDIFGAISTASKSIFRPGVAKIFILLPCSSCQARDMKLDYSSMKQLLLEEGIQLHILASHEFSFTKPRLNRVFFGLDKTLAYSKVDNQQFKGSTELRSSVKITNPEFRACTSLAIESNGSVFAGRKLRPEKFHPVKKISSVFAKRIAKTASQKSCQLCECSGHNTGIAFMSCNRCENEEDDIYPEEDIEIDAFNKDDFDLDWDEDDFGLDNFDGEDDTDLEMDEHDE